MEISSKAHDSMRAPRGTGWRPVLTTAADRTAKDPAAHEIAKAIDTPS